MENSCFATNLKTMWHGTVFTRIIAPCLVGALLFTPALAKAASLSTDLLTQIKRDSSTVFLEDTNFMFEAAGPVVDSVGLQTASGSPSLVDASASASVEFDYGLFRGQSSVFLDYGGIDQDEVWSSVSAVWQDGVTINAIGSSGSTGTLTARVFVSGIGDASMPGGPSPSGVDLVTTSYAVQLLNNGNVWSGIQGGWTTSEDGPFSGDPLGQEYFLSTQFVFGDSWDLGLEVYLSSWINLFGSNQGTYSGEINLSNTIGWLGIDSITDEFGNPISNFTISSDSGFDWSSAHPSAVPIPPSVWLFSAGLIGLIGVARRKRA